MTGIRAAAPGSVGTGKLTSSGNTRISKVDGIRTHGSSLMSPAAKSAKAISSSMMNSSGMSAHGSSLT